MNNISAITLKNLEIGKVYSQEEIEQLYPQAINGIIVVRPRWFGTPSRGNLIQVGVDEYEVYELRNM